MSYQVLARKWRPQRFDEVVGQRGVTQTLRNAITTGRIAQAFVFAGARGVGKTTTARILARALNCEHGPTPDPCGTCDMCVEIAEGRDLDVLEIDAATHTGVDNVRDVIIDGLSIRPVRDRYKIFIIDEVHQLSSSSFNALLKSMEEPPPHVVFMMATTELHKIPDTILSRAQVFELRTIGTRAIAEQLRRIAAAEGVEVTEEALSLIARAAEGSMRDAQSAFDQVLAFGGGRVDAPQVSDVLGLVERDLLLDVLDLVAREDVARVFDVAGRLVESGHDLKHVCRELARLVRDLMVLQIDSQRAADPDLAIEGDGERLRALAAAFSREDLLRAFDLVAKLEADVRIATQPRYHLEMALLRWVHLRKLVPIEKLLEALEQGGPLPKKTPLPSSVPAARPPERAPVRTPAPVAPATAAKPTPPPTREAPAVPVAGPAGPAPGAPASAATAASSGGPPGGTGSAAVGLLASDVSESALARYRDALMDEIKRTQPAATYNLVFMTAKVVEVSPASVTFIYESRPRMLATQFEQLRPTLDAIAARLAGRPMKVAARDDEGAGARSPAAAGAAEKERLKAEVMKEPVVQTLLEVFPSDIRDVQEIDDGK